MVIKYSQSIYGGGNSKSSSPTEMGGKISFAVVLSTIKAPPMMGAFGNPSMSLVELKPLVKESKSPAKSLALKGGSMILIMPAPTKLMLTERTDFDIAFGDGEPDGEETL